MAPLAQGSARRRRELQGASITEYEYAAGTRLCSHVHEHPYLTLALDGVFEENWRGDSYEFRPGAVMVRPPGTEHGNVFGDAGGRCLVVDIPADSFVGRRISAVRYLDHGPVVAAAWKIYQELRCPDTASDLVVNGLLLEVLGWLQRYRRPDRGYHSRPSWLRRSHERLADEYLDPPSIADLADDVGVHPDHLIRRFRECYGITPASWVRTRRLEWAADRLRNSDDRISTIALDAGFADQSHFSRAFRQRFGTPPGRYRRG